MKFKVLIIGLIFILLSGVLVVSADNTDIDDYNFNIPEGYHIKNCSDEYILLENNDHYTISISVLNSSIDRDVLKYMLERSMYDFTYSDNYTKGDFDIEESHYNQEYQRGILYFCDNGDDLLVIDYKVSLLADIDESPLELILDSFV